MPKSQLLHLEAPFFYPQTSKNEENETDNSETDEEDCEFNIEKRCNTREPILYTKNNEKESSTIARERAEEEEHLKTIKIVFYASENAQKRDAHDDIEMRTTLLQILRRADESSAQNSDEKLLYRSENIPFTTLLLNQSIVIGFLYQRLLTICKQVEKTTHRSETHSLLTILDAETLEQIDAETLERINNDEFEVEDDADEYFNEKKDVSDEKREITLPPLASAVDDTGAIRRVDLLRRSERHYVLLVALGGQHGAPPRRVAQLVSEIVELLARKQYRRGTDPTLFGGWPSAPAQFTVYDCCKSLKLLRQLGLVAAVAPLERLLVRALRVLFGTCTDDRVARRKIRLHTRSVIFLASTAVLDSLPCLWSFCAAHDALRKMATKEEQLERKSIKSADDQAMLRTLHSTRSTLENYGVPVRNHHDLITSSSSSSIIEPPLKNLSSRAAFDAGKERNVVARAKTEPDAKLPIHSQCKSTFARILISAALLSDVSSKTIEIAQKTIDLYIFLPEQIVQFVKQQRASAFRAVRDKKEVFYGNDMLDAAWMHIRITFPPGIDQYATSGVNGATGAADDETCVEEQKNVAFATISRVKTPASNYSNSAASSSSTSSFSPALASSFSSAVSAQPFFSSPIQNSVEFPLVSIVEWLQVVLWTYQHICFRVCGMNAAQFYSRNSSQHAFSTLDGYSADSDEAEAACEAAKKHDEPFFSVTTLPATFFDNDDYVQKSASLVWYEQFARVVRTHAMHIVQNVALPDSLDF